VNDLQSLFLPVVFLIYRKILALTCSAGEFRDISSPTHAILPLPGKTKLLSTAARLRARQGREAETRILPADRLIRDPSVSSQVTSAAKDITLARSIFCIRRGSV
jgi:hypothetical protein